MHIQSTQKEMIPASNAITRMRRISLRIIVDTTKSESIGTAQSSLHATPNAWCLHLYLAVELPLVPICSSPLFPPSITISPGRSRHVHSVGSTSCSAYSTALFSCLPAEQNTPNSHVSCTEVAAYLQFLPSCCTKSGVHSIQITQR
jgi:hypothetical protein